MAEAVSTTLVTRKIELIILTVIREPSIKSVKIIVFSLYCIQYNDRA